MRHSTMGINYYTGIEVPVKVREVRHCDKSIDSRFRLIYISKGSGLIETPAGLSTFIAPALCCINETETIEIQSPQNTEIIELVFHPEFLNPAYSYKSIRHTQPPMSIAGELYEVAWMNAFIKRSDNYSGIISISSGISLRIDTLLRQMKKELKNQRDWYWPCRTRSLLLELLLVIDRIYVEPMSNEAILITEKDNSINEIITYLLSNYDKKLQLTDLTYKFNINRTSLNEDFKKATGYTVMNYLLNLRIHLAMSMLKDTALQVSEIMYRVGFANISHFVRSFKKITGLSPMEYRRLHTWLYK
jgi:AraC-like DNA-binding protein